MSQNLEYFEVQEGNVLEGSTNRYLVNQFIGSGSFGRVAKTVNLTTGEDVALKVLKAKKSSAARREIEMLRAVQALDSDKTNLVRCFEVFEHGGFTCLAFEMLDRSLFQLMVDREWEPLPLPEIRPIAQQLLTAFDALKSIGVIHADLKADNIMLVNHQDQPFRVKLIDFGLSMRTSEVRDGLTIQVDAFRAPEVFLGLPLSEAVDMWSLGVLLSLLFTSSYLFGSSCQYQVLKNIVEIVGQPSDRLLDAGRFTQQFFKEDRYFHSPKWWLKTPAEYHLESGSKPRLLKRSVNSLHDLIDQVRPEMEGGIQIADDRAFVSFLMCLLNTDPHMRISPEQALKHPFISMVHLEEEMDSSDYVFESHEKMVHTLIDESEDKLSVEEVDVIVCVGAEAAADGPDEEAPAEEEPSPDSDGSPSEAPKKNSRFKRFKKFCSRAIRRVFRMRRTSE